MSEVEVDCGAATRSPLKLPASTAPGTKSARSWAENWSPIGASQPRVAYAVVSGASTEIRSGVVLLDPSRIWIWFARSANGTDSTLTVMPGFSASNLATSALVSQKLRLSQVIVAGAAAAEADSEVDGA